ncbi:hypothetical protein [Novosphingobium sp. THN1]|uniref:hypothetical protein n=1 Tax=Novosphingobium sp. THN1 TaxID=1016987 RepID=UPI0013C340E6|nr:hypothetical protein [Novosphingobium sp. THN1]
MALFQALSNWLDRRGDLSKFSSRIFQLGPLIFTATVLTFVWNEVTNGVIFWVLAAASVCLCLFYYTAFIVAFVRQRERFYQRESRPHLNREYQDK